MEIVRSPEKLQNYIKKWNINSHFDTPNLYFQLFHYNPGECVTSPDAKVPYIQFLVDGKLQLTNLSPDGNEFFITSIESPALLGEVEFLGGDYPSFFVEAVTSVYFVSLSIERYRSLLLQDHSFILYIANVLCKKLHGIQGAYTRLSLKDTILMYFKSAPNKTINSVSRLAFSVNASTRQVIRVLNRLTSKGIIEHKGKGIYTLVKNDQIPSADVNSIKGVF